MIKIECAKVFFANLEAEGYKVVFQPQLKKDKIAGIIADVLKD
jgi:restriction endonuclease